MNERFNPKSANFEVNQKVISENNKDGQVFVSFNANLIPPSAQPTFPLHWNFLDNSTTKVIKPLMPLGPGEAVYFPSKQKSSCKKNDVNETGLKWSFSEINLVVDNLKKNVTIDKISKNLPNKSLSEIQQLIHILKGS